MTYSSVPNFIFFEFISRNLGKHLAPNSHTLVYRCLNGLAPSYRANDLQCVADLDARRCLRSASTSTLVVPVTRLSTVGDRAFPVDAARVWNSLPADVTLSPSLSTFIARDG